MFLTIRKAVLYNKYDLIITARMIQAIYDSFDRNEEIKLDW